MSASKWTESRIAVHGVANDSLCLDFFDESISELIVYGCCDDKSLSVDAGLAIVAHPASVGSIHGSLHVSVLHDNEGVGATQFKTTLLDVLGAENGNLSASCRTTCKFAGSDSTVSKDSLALVLRNKEILVFALAKASLTHRLVDSFSTKRCRWRVLEQNRVAHDHWRNARLEGKPEGEVPRHDHKSGSKRLVSDDASLILVDNVELFILQEPLCIFLVPLHVADALVNLTLSLGERLAHLLHNKRGIGSLVLLKNFLQEA